jgi:glucokinase
MANRPSWGVTSGDLLAKKLKIPIFKLYGDFVYASYSIFNMKEEELICLNGAKK